VIHSGGVGAVVYRPRRPSSTCAATSTTGVRLSLIHQKVKEIRKKKLRSPHLVVVVVVLMMASGRAMD
jgi:hypothetical protein